MIDQVFWIKSLLCCSPKTNFWPVPANRGTSRKFWGKLHTKSHFRFTPSNHHYTYFLFPISSLGHHQITNKSHISWPGHHPQVSTTFSLLQLVKEIVAIFKFHKPRSDPWNYHPISLLSFFSKILGKNPLRLSHSCQKQHQQFLPVWVPQTKIRSRKFPSNQSFQFLQ